MFSKIMSIIDVKEKFIFINNNRTGSEKIYKIIKRYCSNKSIDKKKNIFFLQ